MEPPVANQADDVAVVQATEQTPEDDPKAAPEDTNSTTSQSYKQCCACLLYDGVNDAKAYSILGVGRGSLLMSNIFLSSSLLYLASEEAGCLDDEGDVIDDCPNKIYGFSPSSFITNIAVITGLLSAFFMPIIGAVVDFTPYRKLTGILAAAIMTLIQAIQIGTVQKTWFAMAILQSIAGFIYQVEVVAVYAYLPDISGIVGEKRMTDYSSRFILTQFGAQSAFLFVVIAISLGLGTTDVQTAQISQGINTVCIIIFFYWGWKVMSTAPANHVLPEGRSLLTEGFKQNWQTAKNINRHYKHGLRWFLLAAIFAEACKSKFVGGEWSWTRIL
jgi:MFS-type transporter involved in bile tolerance (Atg22 family)